MKNQIEKFLSFLFVIISIMLVVAFVGSTYFFQINSKEDKPAESTALTKISDCEGTVYNVSRIRSKLAGNGYYGADSQP
jgi:flagellar basal body-associated protein FliL